MRARLNQGVRSDPLKLRMNQRLEELRLTLGDVAERTGESYRNVHRWMREDVKVPAHFLGRFVEVVPVDSTWLLTGAGTPDPVAPSRAEEALDRIAAVLASVRVASDSGALAEQVVQGSVDGILAFDTGFRYTLWNPAMARISGVGATEVLGRVAFEVFPFLEETGEREFFKAALRGESSVSSVRPFQIPSSGRNGWFEGHYSPIRNGSGAVVGGLGVIRDVTQWKEAVARLEESEERYRRLLELSRDPVMVQAGGEIVYANRALGELLAVDATELTGSPAPTDFVVEGGAHHLHRPDGTRIPVEIQSVCVEVQGRRGTQVVLRRMGSA